MNTSNPCGWVMIDKPYGMFSTRVVSHVRRTLGCKKAGHAGTLDPLASGLLPVAVGEATKTVPLLAGAHKTYRFTVRWGIATDSDDAAGKITGSSDARPALVDIKAIIREFVGCIDQRPPNFSAIKIDGKRAYAKARAGEMFEIKLRKVDIISLTLLEMIDQDLAEFEVTCGGGTYVRSLARDIAIRLGTLGHIVQLRRTAIGDFSVSEAQMINDSTDQHRHDNLTKPALWVTGIVPAICSVIGTERVLAVDSVAATLLGRGIAVSLPDSRSTTKQDAQSSVLAHTQERAVALCSVDGELMRPTRVINLPASDS